MMFGWNKRTLLLWTPFISHVPPPDFHLPQLLLFSPVWFLKSSICWQLLKMLTRGGRAGQHWHLQWNNIINNYLNYIWFLFSSILTASNLTGGAKDWTTSPMIYYLFTCQHLINEINTCICELCTDWTGEKNLKTISKKNEYPNIRTEGKTCSKTPTKERLKQKKCDGMAESKSWP